MSIPFGHRAVLRELKVMETFLTKDAQTISDITHVCHHIDDKNEIEPVAAVTAAVIDLKRYGLLEEDKDQDWWKQKRYKLTDKGKQFIKEHQLYEITDKGRQFIEDRIKEHQTCKQ